MIGEQLLNINIQTPDSATVDDELIAELTDGFQPGQQECKELELITLLRNFKWRRQVLAGALSASQVAQLLGTSQQTPHDLVKSGIWKSFLFTKPLYAPDKDGLSFCGLIDMLLAMANYRQMPASSMLHFIPYPADTLYVLALNQDLVVAQLMELGKKWRADSVDICDGASKDEEWEFREYTSLRLKRALWGDGFKREREAVIICYW